jgi:hypothetical protein
VEIWQEEVPDEDLSSQYYITGVGQYPLSGIYAFMCAPLTSADNLPI